MPNRLERRDREQQRWLIGLQNCELESYTNQKGEAVIRSFQYSVVPGTDVALVIIFAEHHLPGKAKLEPGFQW